MVTRVSRFAVCLFVLLLVLSGCGRKDEVIEVKSGIAAKVKDSNITDAMVDARFEQLNEHQKKDFRGIEGRAKFVDRLIEEQVIYEEALALGIQREKNVQELLEQAKKSILISEYYKREVFDKIEISDEEIQDYYESNEDEFTTRPVYKAQHIFSKDSLKAAAWKRRLNAGENFAKIAKEESEDETTAPAGGSLGYFNPGGYIKGVGYSQVWSSYVEKLQPGEISGVVPFEKGYSIVKVNEIKPAQLMPLAEVHKQIFERLRSQAANNAFSEKTAALVSKYKPKNYARDRFEKTTRTPEELWEIAQIEDDPNKRIKYYQELEDRYPDHKYAPQALFMIGFVYAEEIQDIVQARRVFDKLIEEYPDSEVIESAKWMIEHLNEPHPKFESMESVKEKVEEQKKTAGESGE